MNGCPSINTYEAILQYFTIYLIRFFPTDEKCISYFIVHFILELKQHIHKNLLFYNLFVS